MTTNRTGKVLRGMRKGAMLTQCELAFKVGLTCPQYISNIERGLCSVSANIIHKASMATNSPALPLIEACALDSMDKMIKVIEELREA